MSNEPKALAIVPRTIDEVNSLSERFAKSALIPADLRAKPADVLVTLLAGQELGLAPMAALRSIHVIKGKPVLSADAMVGIVLASGAAEYFRATSRSATSVTYETKRRGCDPVSLTWTIEDAERAGLSGGDNWKKYPRAMLSARCKAELARDVYPDVLAGVYEESEAAEFGGDIGHGIAIANADTRDATNADAIDAEVVEYPLDDVLRAIRECETADDLRKVAATLGDAPKSAQPAINAAYKERKAQLAGAAA